LHGVLSGLIALASLAALHVWISGNIPELVRHVPFDKMLILAVAIVGTGIFIYVFSTFIVVNKYLKMRVDDLY
jgi:cell division transport system permease protein